MLTVLGVAAAIIVTLFALYKLIDQVVQAEDRFEFTEIDQRLEALDTLARERALIVKELKEIELDYETGKLDDEDFERLERRFKRKWLKVDTRITELGGDVERLRDDIEEELDARIEGLIGHQDTRKRQAPERHICRACAAANPLEATRCVACDASLQSPRSTPLQPAEST